MFRPPYTPVTFGSFRRRLRAAMLFDPVREYAAARSRGGAGRGVRGCRLSGGGRIISHALAKRCTYAVVRERRAVRDA